MGVYALYNNIYIRGLTAGRVLSRFLSGLVNVLYSSCHNLSLLASIKNGMMETVVRLHLPW